MRSANVELSLIEAVGLLVGCVEAGIVLLEKDDQSLQ